MTLYVYVADFSIQCLLYLSGKDSVKEVEIS